MFVGRTEEGVGFMSDIEGLVMFLRVDRDVLQEKFQKGKIEYKIGETKILGKPLREK
jgi:hypothetical protein